MKKLLHFLALAALICVPWVTQGQQSLPYSYGFEDNDLSTDGWTTVNESTNNAGEFGINTAAKKTGTYGFRFSSYSRDYTSYNQYLISPELAGTNGVVVTFCYAASSSYGTETFKVGYSTTDDDISSFTFGDEISTSSTSWTLSGEFAFPAGTKYVAIYYYSDYQYRLYVDDISFTAPASCAKPTGLAATVTPGSGTIATLNWTAGGTETNWTIDYSTTADFSSNVTSTTATGTPTKDLTGLTAETMYYARVKADCGGGDESEWSTTCTFTPTNAYNITVNDGTTTNEYVPIYGYYCDNLTRSQFIIPATSLTAMQWGTINELTFYASNPSVDWGSAEFEVYVMETDETTLDALVDWTDMTKVMTAGSLSITGNQMVVTLTTPYHYQDGNLMIGFKQTVEDEDVHSYWYGVSATGASMGGYEGTYSTSITQRNFLPKTTFSYTPGAAPACAKPTGLTVDNVTGHTAELEWTQAGSVSEWEVCVNGDESNLIHVTDNPYILTNLEQDADYTIKVRAYCDALEQSTWSSEVNFHTLVTCATPTALTATNITADGATISWTAPVPAPANGYKLRYAELGQATVTLTAGDVWGDGSGYQMLLDPTHSLYGTTISTSDGYLSANCTGNEAIYNAFGYKIPTNADGECTTTNMVNSTSVTIQIPAGTYDWCITNPTPGDRIWIAASNGNVGGRYDDYEFEPGVTYEFTAAGFPNNEDGVNVTITGTPSYTWTVVNNATSPYNLSGLDPETNYRVEVQADCGGGESSNWVPLTFTTLPSCLPVTNLAVGDVTTSIVELTWTDNNGGTASYVVTDGSDNPVTVTALTTTGCTVTGLTANTAYTFKVKADCGGNYSSVVTIDTRTLCEAVTITLENSLTEGFESYSGVTYNALGVVPDCWDRYSTGSVAPHVIGSGSYYYVHDGTKALTFYGSGNCYAALPEFTNDISELQISFWMQTESASNGSLTLGYITASDVDYNTFTEIETYTNSYGSMVQRTTELNSVPAEAARLVFRWYYSGQYSCCIDDLKVSLVRPCKKPTALTCTNYTATTATLSWTVNGTNQPSWQLYISESNVAPADDINEALVINATTNPYTVTTGLVAEHTYYAWVRGNCSASSEGYSEWSESLEFMPNAYHDFTYQPSAASNTGYVPFYGYYANNATNKGQILIPASNFPAEMGDATVRRLTFYTTNSYANVDWGAAEFDVLVAEVDATSFESSAFFDWNDMTTVYSGSLSVSGQQMVIDLDAPFTYNGGNLLIGFDLTTTGASASVYWVATYGSTNLGAYQYGTSSVSRTYYQPKITFNYLPSATPRPTNVHPTEELSTEATLAWTAPYGVIATGYEYQYKIATEEVWSAAAPAAGLNVTLTGLTPEKTYDFRVRAVYAGPAYSQYATTQFTTPAACPIPDGLAASNLTMNTADLEWNASVEVANYTVQYRTAAGVQALFEEGFEDATEFAENWTLNNCVSGTNRNTSAKQTGDYGFKFAYNGYSSGITPPQYLISSDLSAYTTNDVTLTFYYKKDGSFTETFKVGWSSTTNDPAEFTWDIEITATSSWENYSHTIPAGTKYISIAYTADDQLSLYIDDLVIGNTLAAGSWNTATATAPNTGEYQLMGLTAGTKYDVRVYAECAADPETENDMITITTLANGNKVFTNAGGDGLWGTNANWVPAGAPTITDNAIIRANATIPNGTVATAKKITFEGTPTPTLTLADGGQLIANNSVSLTVQKSATANSWMGISAPVFYSSGSTSLYYTSTNLKGAGAYDLMQYTESSSTWQSQKSTSTMSQERGYIYRRADATTLTFTGSTHVGNQSANSLVTWSASDASLKGFNLIGNPYPHAIYYGAAIPTTNLAEGFYILQTNGTWRTVAGADINTTAIGVGEAIMVKASAAISPFEMTDVATAPTSSKAHTATLAFTVSNDEYSDVAYAMFSNGEGLPKMSHLNAEAPMLYIPTDEGRYAIAMMEESVESFPLNFNGYGEYTLSVNNSTAFGYLHLIDRATGRDIDLLSQSTYTFNANGSSDRFTVKLSPSTEENGRAIFVWQENGNVVVEGDGDLQVFDVMGRQLGTTHVDGTTTFSRGDLGMSHSGVYVLRLNGNSQKIVVK